jgi:putative flavoprotein involved in K+ transport
MPMPSPTADQPLDVIVIGAGQAGLALGHHLARRGADFALLDAGPEIGSSWRSRWDSLRLFSPAQYDSLPGLPFPAPVDTHPRKDEVADYL